MTFTLLLFVLAPGFTPTQLRILLEKHWEEFDSGTLQVGEVIREGSGFFVRLIAESGTLTPVDPFDMEKELSDGLALPPGVESYSIKECNEV